MVEMKECLEKSKEDVLEVLGGMTVAPEAMIDAITRIASTMFIQGNRNGEKPSPDAQKYLDDLCRDLELKIGPVTKDQANVLIDVLKVLRSKQSAGQKSTGPVKKLAASIGACEVCGNPKISKAVEDYSREHFGNRLLCFDCQQSEKAKSGATQ